VLWLRLPAFLFMVALIGAIAYTSVDARFFVYDAQITGNRYIERERIYEEAGLDEQNIFWIRSRKVIQRIAQMPGIKAVHVRCELPAQVAISVEERVPVVMWRSWAHGKDWWLDEEGLVLPYGGDTDSPDTVFVVDSSQRQLQEGARIEPPEIVQWVRQLAAELPGARVFYYQADRGLYYVQKRDGYDWRVYLGDGENLQGKIQATQALTDYMVANNIYPSYIDVRWPELPVYGQANSGGDVGGGD
jgi:cell division septal protein FtsQ